MLKPITTKTTVRYTPPNQPDDEAKTAFLLKPWTKAVYAAIMDRLRDANGGEGVSNTAQIPADVTVDGFRAGLMAFENFLDDRGAEITVQRREDPACFGVVCQMATHDSINAVPFAAVQGAFLDLLLECRFDEADRGNS